MKDFPGFRTTPAVPHAGSLVRMEPLYPKKKEIGDRRKEIGGSVSVPVSLFLLPPESGLRPTARLPACAAGSPPAPPSGRRRTPAGRRRDSDTHRQSSAGRLS